LQWNIGAEIVAKENLEKPWKKKEEIDDLYLRTDIHEMFSSTVPTYDLLNHVFSLNIDRMWRRKLVKRAALPSDGHLVDLCTGTADVAIVFAKKRPDITVTGVDFSLQMLARGKQKVDDAGVAGRVELQEADALHLPYENDTFDAATVAFGLRNLPDWPGGIREMARVVEPGEKVLILEFSPAPPTLFGKLYLWYMRHIMEPLGAKVSGYWKTYGYLYSSITHFLRADELASHMRDAGIAEVEVERLTSGIAYIHSGVKHAT